MDNVLSGKHIVLGITGGIAAYKSCELVSRLKKAGACVKVIMTQHACEFVDPQTFETLSGNPVCTDMFKREQPWEVEHISLAAEADLFVIAPATANIIGKMANGIADDMLSTTVMATRAPVLLAPAMNTNMWENPAVQGNMDLLMKRGMLVIGPEGGRLTCGTSGTGRM
ncbi:MAG: bifunctional 4'-phosphopantothenoylcysteine decarboxylase/phosphopantothenoylcysteine synthetase, partial [Clostridiales bacterium]|nr:bifunctional 4'-phosphopantothenoylcysteine decarboxylase/phosphopantothenoylcysteine synthetase [Clostridiales bacterium]